MQENNPNMSIDDRRQWARDNMLQYRALKDVGKFIWNRRLIALVIIFYNIQVQKLKGDIEARLKDFCIICEEQKNEKIVIKDRLRFVRSEDDPFKESLILIVCFLIFVFIKKWLNWNSFKLIIAGAFYPNYFNVSNRSEDTAIQRLAGREPRNTIIVITT